jgi:hypothetical protein
MNVSGIGRHFWWEGVGGNSSVQSIKLLSGSITREAQTALASEMDHLLAVVELFTRGDVDFNAVGTQVCRKADH